jgi:hypothetical protein
MAWTNPRTWVANVTAITAAALNTDLRDNLNYLKGLLDGTGSDTVTVPGTLVVDDANYSLLMSGGTLPAINVDTGGDIWFYNRPINTYTWRVAGLDVLTVDANGKLGGRGFYDSGAVTIADTATQAFTHGLGARADTSTTGVNTIVPDPNATTQVHFTTATNTVISVRNVTGVTRYARVFAML